MYNVNVVNRIVALPHNFSQRGLGVALATSWLRPWRVIYEYTEVPDNSDTSNGVGHKTELTDGLTVSNR